MFVSPIGISDNVLRVMKAGSTNEFVLDLPEDVEPGTYWYHAHLHGRVEEQVFAGLSGVFIVDGLQDRLPPELQDVPERVMAIKDLQVKDGAIVRSNIDSNAPTTRTVNGQVEPYAHRGDQSGPSCCGSPTLVPTSGTGYVSTARNSM